MTFKLPELPYSMDALAPHMSKETLEFHYGKHHNTYVTTLNKLLEKENRYAKASLEDIVREAPQGPLFNNAAQSWNHTFFWNCLSPDGGGEPGGAMEDVIKQSFDSFENFKEKFSSSAAALFGSGWTWLVKRKNGSLAIENLSNAGNPLTSGQTPILACDVWEHAYYIDYRNVRADYIKAFWNVVNWEFAESQLQGTKQAVAGMTA